MSPMMPASTYLCKEVKIFASSFSSTVFVWIGRNLASYVQGREAELDVPEPVHQAEAGNPPYHEVRSYFGLHLKGWFRELFKLF